MEKKNINPYLLPGINNVIEREAVIRVVAEYFSMSPEDIKDKRRKREIVMPRQIALFVMFQKIPRITWREATEPFNLTHAMAQYYLKTVKNLYDTDKGYKDIVDEILQKDFLI